jgi:prepilin-type processing-associated H-X9-DG protein
MHFFGYGEGVLSRVRNLCQLPQYADNKGRYRDLGCNTRGYSGTTKSVCENIKAWHNGYCNIAFYDGHAASLTLGDALLIARWHYKKWQNEL